MNRCMFLAVFAGLTAVTWGSPMQKRVAVRSTTSETHYICILAGEILEPGQSSDDGCTCTEDGYLMCARDLRSTTSETHYICILGGEILEPGQSTDDGCTCTDDGYLMCARSSKKRTSEPIGPLPCLGPNGQVLEAGESMTVNEGESSCAVCTCYAGHVGCVSCQPPLQQEVQEELIIPEQSTSSDTLYICLVDGVVLKPGVSTGTGAHRCSCTDDGYVMCARNSRRTSPSHCRAPPPDGGLYVDGETFPINDGDICGTCTCQGGNMACQGVSCSPPVQEQLPEYHPQP